MEGNVGMDKCGKNPSEASFLLESAKVATEWKGSQRTAPENTGAGSSNTVAAGFDAKSVWLKHGENRVKFDLSICPFVYDLIVTLRKGTALQIDPFSTIEIHEPEGTAPLDIGARLDELFTADILKNSNSKPFVVISIPVDWIPERVTPSYLEEDRMHFVNRHDAVIQLQQVHESNMNLARHFKGTDWKIPLVDNLSGMGKSALANHYTRQCKIQSHNPTPDFNSKIVDCHTIVISFASHHAALVDSDQDAVISGLIEKKIRALVELPSFLWVGAGKIYPSAFRVVRISLHNLRQVHIEAIIRQTQFSEENPISLLEHFKIHDDRVKDVSEHLFRVTNGHPRTLLEALKSCGTEDELLDYNDPLLNMDQGRSVNLTRVIKRDRSKISLDRIVGNVYLRWEGTIELAAPPALLNFVRGCYLPLREYLEDITPSRTAPFNCLNSFEWINIMRLQELFATKTSPSGVSPFFKDTSFGQCHGVVLSADVLPIPQITAKESSVGSSSSSLAKTYAWQELLTSMGQSDCACFKSFEKSDSVDAIFIVKDVLFCSRAVRLCVGIGIESFYVAEFTVDDFRDECDKFNTMFLHQKDRNCLNILIICATKYAKSFQEKFRKGKSVSIKKPGGFANIHEVILLNLHSKLDRALFYGLEAGSQLAEVLECIIAQKEKERTRH